MHKTLQLFTCIVLWKDEKINITFKIKSKLARDNLTIPNIMQWAQGNFQLQFFFYGKIQAQYNFYNKQQLHCVKFTNFQTVYLHLTFYIVYIVYFVT